MDLISTSNGQNVLGEFFEKYLELTIRNYLAQKAALDQQFRNWLNMGKDLFAQTPTLMSPFPTIDSLFNLFPRSQKEAKQDPPGQE